MDKSVSWTAGWSVYADVGRGKNGPRSRPVSLKISYSAAKMHEPVTMPSAGWHQSNVVLLKYKVLFNDNANVLLSKKKNLLMALNPLFQVHGVYPVS